MNGYGYGQGSQEPLRGQNSSGMSYQLGRGMPMQTQATPCPNVTVPFPAQPTPYSNNSASYPGLQTAPYPSQPPQAHSSYSGIYQPQAVSYPGQAMSQPPQQAYPSQASQASYQGHYGAVPNPMAQTPPFNPMYTVQPTAPPACSQSNNEYDYALPTNYLTSASSSQVAPLTTNTQFAGKLTPTVLHNPNFNAANDAKVLQKAINGHETDKEAIITILSNRNNQHRQSIANSFKILDGKNLIEELKSGLSGKFEDLIVAMMTPIIDYYVKEVHDSIWGMSTNEDVLIIILCTLRNHDIQQISASYEKKYGESLQSHIRGITPGYLDRLLESFCHGKRDESTHTDINSAKYDAMKLHSAGISRLRTNESEFLSILAQRNVQQLNLIFQEYSRIWGCDIEREFPGHNKKDLLTDDDLPNKPYKPQQQQSDVRNRTDDRKLIFI
ncbi:hypothetical protein HCN44_009972 [Aphidius gifuensis]|uniref:Annexin n=1 Tax=Aphidius gifuensis TaxID=684658 RepID=A0A835CZ99_APHGI|nr:hypothetical protein HCN44_009972 [Aphidius gifuensis]